MARYDVEAYSVGLAMRLGLPVTAVATIGTALRAAHEAGADDAEAERDRLRAVVDAARRVADCHQHRPGPITPCWSLFNGLRNALAALDAATGKEAGT